MRERGARLDFLRDELQPQPMICLIASRSRC